MTQRTQLRCLGVFLLAICVAAYAPIFPRLPDKTMDPSWMLAMNQAVAQGLVFGRDIVFTFGPYASLYTQAYHPANYVPTLLLGTLLGLCYAAMLWLLMQRPRPDWVLGCCGFLLLIDSRDALFFSYPLLVILLAFQLTAAPSGAADPMATGGPARAVPPGMPQRLCFAVAMALLGLLPIVKGSFLLLAVLAALVGFALFWQRGARGFATLFLVLPLLAMAAAWQAAGQPLAALPDYFRSMASIISGYSDAMALYPARPAWWVNRIAVPAVFAAYLAIAALLTYAVRRAQDGAGIRGAVLVACVGLFFATVLKAAFVRHDAHALTAGAAPVLVILLLSLSDLIRLSRWAIASVVIAWVLVHGTYQHVLIEDTPLDSMLGMLSGERLGAKLPAAFKRQLLAIDAESPVRRMPGSTDIYPYDLAALIASRNLWAPRPVPQSYSAYTPALARSNAAHLLGPKAPQHVVFRVKTIDERYPSLDDGLSWPSLWTHYAVAGQDARYLYLNRQPAPLPLEHRLLLEGHPRCGETVELPTSSGILFAQIDIPPTLLGRVANLLFKSGTLALSVDTADGQNQDFRFIAGMASSGFVLSPLVRSNADWLQLAALPAQVPEATRVQRFRLTAAQGCGLFWQGSYGLQLFALQAGDSRAAVVTQTVSLP